MDKIRIEGGARLAGQVSVSGAKNASLPAMAASLLTGEPLALTNVPAVWDVNTMRRLLSELGVVVDRQPNNLRLSAHTIRSHEAPYELVKTMRASVLVLGPLLARNGRARVSLPGGCAIGARPIDLHLKALKQMGAAVTLEHGFVEAATEGLRGADITFPQVTVTGTEKILMAATLATGTTTLRNCAREPEVLDLVQLLKAMGAQIEGEGTGEIRVEGVPRLTGASHRIIPDRIETGTYLIAGALIGNGIDIVECCPTHLKSVTNHLQQLGVDIESEDQLLRVHETSPDKFHSLDLETRPYPGFPTDMQAQLMVLLTQAAGESHVLETIFDNRFMHVAELDRMGADISVSRHRATIHGPTPLSGTRVMATDLRASACLVLAGLVADNTTVVDRAYHLDRGYERIEEKLAGLGASIERVSH